MNPIEQTEDKPVLTAGEALQKAFHDIEDLKAALADYYVASQGGPAVPADSVVTAYNAAVELGAFPVASADGAR